MPQAYRVRRSPLTRFGPFRLRLAMFALAALGLAVGALLDRPASAPTAAYATQAEATGTVTATSGPTAPLPGSAQSQVADPFDMSGAALDITLKLLAVLALAYVALAALRRYSLGPGLGRRGGHLQVVETATLAPNRSLYLVRAGDRSLLLGVTPTQISTLTTWDAGLPVELQAETSATAAATPAALASSAFRGLLTAATNRHTNP